MEAAEREVRETDVSYCALRSLSAAGPGVPPEYVQSSLIDPDSLTFPETGVPGTGRAALALAQRLDQIQLLSSRCAEAQLHIDIGPPCGGFDLRFV